jgi:hypothetical protein
MKQDAAVDLFPRQGITGQHPILQLARLARVAHAEDNVGPCMDDSTAIVHGPSQLDGHNEVGAASNSLARQNVDRRRPPFAQDDSFEEAKVVDPHTTSPGFRWRPLGDPFEDQRIARRRAV